MPAARFLLVEQPGPWGRTAHLESRFDPAVGARLARRAAAAGARLTFVRRPGRGATALTRHWAWVDAQPGVEAARWGSFAADEDLLEVPLDGSAGDPSGDPVYLVCAHGRHDVDCALRGRPVAAALAALRPAATWECSHVGGCRFAANVVVLPHGLYYAHVTAQRVGELVAAAESERLVPDLLRGRSSLTPPVQAAQHHARIALSEDTVDALTPLSVERGAPDVWTVRLAHPDGPVVATVASSRSEPALLTCAAVRAETVPVFRLLDLATPRN